MKNLDETFKVLHRSFTGEPYSLSYGYFKMCHALADLQDLTIEEDDRFVRVSNVRMEVYGLVMYICHRLRGGRPRSCDFETVFERLKKPSLF